MSDPIKEFFDEFEGETFTFVRECDWRQLGPFNYLAVVSNWDQHRRDNEIINLRDKWKKLVEEEFGDSSLEKHQELCEDLGVYPIPESKMACERELRRLHVNLVDVIQFKWNKRMGKGTSPVTQYRNAEEVKEYAMDEKKTLPGHMAKIGLLRFLLR
jgi:hypothetical protein